MKRQRSRLLALLVTLAPTAHAGSAAWPDLGQPAAKVGGGEDDAALVIGIEDYAFAQDIPGARQNALDWVRWLKDSRKVPLVKPLLNEQATREAMLQAAAQVAERVQPGGRLWIVYVGHGAPSEQGEDGLLVGVDAQQTAQSLEARGLPRGLLLSTAESKLPAGASTVLLLDACFSGKTSSGELAPGLAPLKVVTASLGPKATVLTAAHGSQYAGPLSDGRRPAFSYLVLGALRGWGDADGDGEVSAREALAYADDALLQTITGRSQSPTLEGPDLVLGRAGSEAGPDLTDLAIGAASDNSVRLPSGAGTVSVDLGGDSVDFAALAAQAEAASARAQEAERQRQETERALVAERRRRLDAAAADVQKAANRDFDAIAKLVSTPTAQAEPVLAAWLARYGDAKVSIDGVTEPVAVREVAAVRAALRQAQMPSDMAVSSVGSPASARPADGDIQAAVTRYYAEKGEWKGTFTIDRFVTMRIVEVSSTEFVVHAKYHFQPVPGNRQGRRDVGYDQRTFTFRLQGGQWRCAAMGGHNSARL